jgi:hypothetical protein
MFFVLGSKGQAWASEFFRGPHGTMFGSFRKRQDLLHDEIFVAASLCGCLIAAD